MENRANSIVLVRAEYVILYIDRLRRLGTPVDRELRRARLPTLIEEIDQQIESGKDRYEAVLDSAVSRMRPVVLAAATTILGLIPLLADVFFVNMSVTIMAGLGFASVLTLIVVPTLYAIFFRIKKNA